MKLFCCGGQDDWAQPRAPSEAPSESKTSSAGDMAIEDLESTIALLMRHAVVKRRAWEDMMRRLDGHPDNEDDDYRSVIGLRMIVPDSTLSICWTTASAAVDATYTAFLLPIFIAWDLGLTTAGGVWAIVLEIIAGAMILGDVFMEFHMGWTISFGADWMRVMRGRVVAWFYFRYGTFLLDLLLSLAFLAMLGLHYNGSREEEMVARVSRILRLLRFVRVGRFLARGMKLLFQGASRSDNPMVAGIATIVYITFVYLNFLACFWYWLGRRQGLGSSESWLFVYEFIEVDPDTGDRRYGNGPHAYLNCLYYMITTVTTVGYGEFHPQTGLERFVAIFIMLSGLTFFGTMIGSIIGMVRVTSTSVARNSAAAEKLQELHRFLMHFKLRNTTRRHLQLFFGDVWSRHHAESTHAELLNELPPGLRSGIIYRIVSPHMQSLDVFKSLSEPLLHELAGLMTPVKAMPGYDIMQQGRVAGDLWILTHGSVDMLDQYCRVRRTLTGPRVLGVTALLAETHSDCGVWLQTVRASTACHLWRLSLQDLRPLMRIVPSLQDELVNGLYNYILELLPQSKNMAMDADSIFLLKVLDKERADRSVHATRRLSSMWSTNSGGSSMVNLRQLESGPAAAGAALDLSLGDATRASALSSELSEALARIEPQGSSDAHDAVGAADGLGAGDAESALADAGGQTVTAADAQARAPQLVRLSGRTVVAIPETIPEASTTAGATARLDDSARGSAPGQSPSAAAKPQDVIELPPWPELPPAPLQPPEEDLQHDEQSPDSPP